jgi:F-type H+-transporting ATPase subunit b
MKLPLPSRRLASTLALAALLSLGAAPVLAQAEAPKAAETKLAEPVAHTADATAEAKDEAARTGEVLSGPQKGAVTAITTALVFLILLVILQKLAFGPIAASLKKREDKIRGDLNDAEAALRKAQATLAEYNARLNGAEAEVRALLTKATADAEKIRASLKTQAETEAAEIREKSRKELDSATKAAIAQIHEEAVVLSTSIAEKILKRTINPDDQRDLVRASLSQLKTNN